MVYSPEIMAEDCPGGTPRQKPGGSIPGRGSFGLTRHFNQHNWQFADGKPVRELSRFLHQELWVRVETKSYFCKKRRNVEKMLLGNYSLQRFTEKLPSSTPSSLTHPGRGVWQLAAARVNLSVLFVCTICFLAQLILL